MMLDWLGQKHEDEAMILAGQKISDAVTEVLQDGALPSDLGGTTTTSQFGDLTAEKLLSSAGPS